MPSTLHNLGIDKMSAEDRIRLIGEIWDSLDGYEIPESHRQELDRRIAAADAEPDNRSSWEEVRARLRERQ
jgi:putative addiction module component (TIGR02574 family)